MSDSTRLIRCEILDRQIEFPSRPQRVVCLVAGWTEALWQMGLQDSVVGVSKYCQRYVDTAGKVVAGDYLRVDDAMLDRLNPDLILVTGGVQLGLARRWAKQGRPVFVLPLPDGMAGILENIRRLGALMGEMAAAHHLTEQMDDQIAQLGRGSTGGDKPPQVYAELWFGRHPRMAGGLTFVHDIVRLAGGMNILGELAEGYPRLDVAAVERHRPDVVLLFHEADDHPLDVDEWMQERGWAGRWKFQLIACGIEPGRNLIHDGPSILDTVAWLQNHPSFIASENT
ncbi:MAG: ABC transporter substrate-binding protein [Opitutaceae bacterium]|jgi:iron complex transport system substrate-binding protein|nr:ABC transporter substrate-binding protein [Opitutaceae bacterium]